MIDQHQSEIIKNFLKEAKITDQGLMDDLLDHLSCDIELQMEVGASFEEAWPISREKILPKEPLQVQKDLEFLTTKTQNIMIKKIAYIGGYLSALCLCLAILFFSQSLISSKKVILQSQAMQIESYRLNLTMDNKERRKQLNEELSELSNQNALDRATKFENGELLLIISILTFGLTYLPYRFYSGFRKSEMELT
ncbi:hypothetical protein BFP97_11000 [Roseivirga sp. 4D4]|uniref:hypothetical protein n=1 Tax=Roseivirga sp. 4D4 TaxID=1889784 RepID=UPI000852D543|nr:hypothetical protein [Roseivirga sp. 4D4]OEK02015.1 hypothetical protein BFP97_11000 [Roseivirga sp. 4D4]